MMVTLTTTLLIKVSLKESTLLSTDPLLDVSWDVPLMDLTTLDGGKNILLKMMNTSNGVTFLDTCTTTASYKNLGGFKPMLFLLTTPLENGKA